LTTNLSISQQPLFGALELLLQKFLNWSLIPRYVLGDERGPYDF
jgi:hypothetical protein